MGIKDKALRRGAFFEAMQNRLEGLENRVLGAIKEVIFEDPDLPEKRAAAIAYLKGEAEVKSGKELGCKSPTRNLLM